MNLLLPEPTPGTHLDVAEVTEGLAVAGPALGASPPPESLTLTEAWVAPQGKWEELGSWRETRQDHSKPSTHIVGQESRVVPHGSLLPSHDESLLKSISQKERQDLFDRVGKLYLLPFPRLEGKPPQ